MISVLARGNPDLTRSYRSVSALYVWWTVVSNATIALGQILATEYIQTYQDPRKALLLGTVIQSIVLPAIFFLPDAERPVSRSGTVSPLFGSEPYRNQPSSVNWNLLSLLVATMASGPFLYSVSEFAMPQVSKQLLEPLPKINVIKAISMFIMVIIMVLRWAVMRKWKPFRHASDEWLGGGFLVFAALSSTILGLAQTPQMAMAGLTLASVCMIYDSFTRSLLVRSGETLDLVSRLISEQAAQAIPKLATPQLFIWLLTIDLSDYAGLPYFTVTGLCLVCLVALVASTYIS